MVSGTRIYTSNTAGVSLNYVLLYGVSLLYKDEGDVPASRQKLTKAARRLRSMTLCRL